MSRIGQTYLATKGPYQGQRIKVVALHDDLWPGEDRVTLEAPDGTRWGCMGKEVRETLAVEELLQACESVAEALRGPLPVEQESLLRLLESAIGNLKECRS